MVRRLLILSIVLFFYQLSTASAQITIGTVDPGPYTPGSTIAATFSIGNTSCIQRGNRFDLLLVYPDGTTRGLPPIGSYNGFYSTFVNGIIPAGTPAGTGYKLVITSTAPALTTTVSSDFEIKAGPTVTAQVSSTPINTTFPEVFGFCTPRTNFTLNITNGSTINATDVTAFIKNELNSSETVTEIHFDNPIKQFIPGKAHYTMFVKVKMPDGTTATKAYFIVNNAANTSFSTSSAGLVCLPIGELTYGVDNETENGIQKNFPGNLYRVRWGDGREDLYTLCDLKDGKVKHNYITSSCGRTINNGSGTIYNVFGINIGTESPFCGPIGNSLSTYAKVVTVTENKFIGPLIGCVNSDVTFINTSIPGQNPSTSSSDCIDNGVLYNWYVDGVLVLANVPRSTNLTINKAVAKTYEIKLESISSGECQGPPYILRVCIQNPPRPDFDFNGAPTTFCAPGSLTARNKSIIDNSCSTVNTYNWVVTSTTGPVTNAEVTFNRTAAEPVFNFIKPGIYNVSLEINTPSCGIARTPTQQVIIADGAPQIFLSPNINLCRLDTYAFNETTTGPTKTRFSGTQVDQSDTYTWTITAPDGSALTPGDFSFENGTNANTKYPVIKFNAYKAFKITATHKNSCTTVSSSQTISFFPSPVPSITATPASICYDGVINLTGTVTNGTYTSLRWTSTGLGAFSAPTNLITTYTPTQAERDAGVANIKLTLTTNLTGTCATVEDNLAVVILPKNSGTNTTRIICSGDLASYLPVSTVTGSTFTWTATNPDNNATGFSTTGTGQISENITNTSTSGNAVVIYTITPVSNGCNGVPFTLTVTITPKPAVTAVPANATICSGTNAAVTLTPTLTGTTYTWTSTATNVTGNSNNPVPSALTILNDVLTNNSTPRAQGTVTYKIKPYNANGCPGDEVTITINVDPAVTQANAGTNTSICALTTYTLNGNIPAAGETGTWSLTSGQVGITFDDPNKPGAEARGLVAGETYTFKWTIYAPGACNPTSANVTIVVNLPTVAGTLTSSTVLVCQGTNTGQITLSGNVGTIIRWESSIDGSTWTPIVNTINTLTFNNLDKTTQYRVVVQNGNCNPEITIPITINVNPAITQAVAGPDQEVCNAQEIQLNGNTPGNPSETGRWTQTAGDINALIQDPTNPLTKVTVPRADTYKFKWTITGAAICDPTTSEVTIKNLPPIVNTIGNPTPEVCNGQTITVSNIALSGGNGLYNITWESSTDGTSWTVVPGQTQQELILTLFTTTSFRRKISSGPCPSVSNVITIIAQPPITNNNIATDQIICEGIIPARLTGSTPAGGDGTNYLYQWQFSTDNGTTWTDISGATQSDYIPAALTATTLYRRLVSTIACSGALKNISASVKITVKPNAKAVFTYTTDKGCFPFVIDALNIRAQAFPQGNATYIWYANGTEIGRGITFPGYTINNSSENVVIKLVTISSQSCTDAEMSHTFSTNQDVAASYNQSATSGCGPLLVNFVNTSTSLTNATFKWDFGNGQTSIQVMPAPVTFAPDPSGDDITYTVTLTAYTSCGESVSTSTVFVKAQPKAVFSPDKVIGCSPMLVSFTNTSPGSTNTYYYDFGDGSPVLTKTDKLPVQHTYNTLITQDFTVTMTAVNECGTSQQQFIIRVAPNTITPELVVNATEKEGCAPFKVNFYNNSRGANLFKYDFGDGSTLITRSAPETVSHTFLNPGTYNVTLTASNGCSVVTTTESITVLEQPATAFYANTTVGCPGLAVKFTNTTVGGLSYHWDFGDGTTSDEFEPTHIYSGNGPYYTVTLTATNSLGCTKTITSTNYIHVVPPPVAQFTVNPGIQISIPNYTFNFVDQSTDIPDQWDWDFGDGTHSSQRNPSHTYIDTGLYKVTLKVTNQQGCFTETFKNVRIIGVPGYLFVPNAFIPGSETNELRTFIAKGSGIKTWRFSIFDKWGSVLWETTRLDEGRPAEGWDGTFKGSPVPQGVYYWKIEVEMINGSEWKGMTYGKSAPKRTGAIHLIR